MVHSACTGAVLLLGHKQAASFIPSLMVWSVTKNTVFGREKTKNKKSNGEQSVLCDLEQVTLKPQFEVHNCLTFLLQIWYQ